MDEQPFSAASKERQKKAPQTWIIIVVVVILVAIGFSIYMFFVRPQNGGYDTAINQLNVMIRSTQSIENLKSKDMLDPTTATGTQLSDAQSTSNAYSYALTALEKSPVFAKDGKVATYDKTVHAKMADYSTTTSDMIKTLTAFATVLQSCSTLESDASTITSLTMLKTTETDCKNALSRYQAVPSTDFNSNYFQPFREDTSDFVTALESYYTAAAIGNRTQQQSAQAGIMVALNGVANLNKSVSSPITNSASPINELTKLKTLLSQRRNTFFR